MEDNKKDYFNSELQMKLDKYITTKKYGDFKPFIDDIFQRRKYEFDLSNQQIEDDIRLFKKNVKKIKVISEEKARGFNGFFRRPHGKIIPRMYINK